MNSLELELPLEELSRTVSALLVRPENPRAILALAHGAGAGMRHSFMNDLAEALASVGLATLRYQFPYMEDGGKRPDSPKVAQATVRAAVLRCQKERLPVFAAGKSFGSRMSTQAAAAGQLSGVAGIVCFGFPLHPPKQPSKERAKHLSQVPCPMLFLQGTRDELAELGLVREVTASLKLAKLHVVEGADHGFSVLKRSGRTDEEVLRELAAETLSFTQG